MVRMGKDAAGGVLEMNLKTDQSKYRVFLDPSFEMEKEDGKRAQIWRYYELRGKYGMIYPYNETSFGLWMTSSYLAARLRREKPKWAILQSGKDETVFKIPLEGLFEGAEVIAARRKRVLSPESQERLRQMGFKRLSSS